MKDNETIAEKVLERIEHTTPRSRTYFTVRNALLWLLALLSVLVGALAVGSIIFRAVNAQTALGPRLAGPGPLLRLLPVLWIALLGSFGYLAYREVRQTRRGYKYELSTLVLAMLLLSTVLGTGFYTIGAGFLLDRLAGEYVPFHTSLERIQRERWMQPEQGFLVGIVSEEAHEGEDLEITDPSAVVWHIDFDPSITDAQIESLIEGERVGLQGKLLATTTHEFLACEIRSLEFVGRGRIPQSSKPRFVHVERNETDERTTGCEDVRPLLIN